MRIYILLICLFGSSFLFSQYNSDALRLSKMEYMKYATHTDCNGDFNSSLEHRICLNLEFQKVDALLNVNFKKLCDTIDEPTVKRQIIEYHESWIDYRRLQSKLVSKGYRGHMLGIVYLGSMIEMTKRRAREIDVLLENY